MTSTTTLNDDPFAPANTASTDQTHPDACSDTHAPVGGAMAGWLHTPTGSEPERLVHTWNPFSSEPRPEIPPGYEHIPHDMPYAVRPIRTPVPTPLSTPVPRDAVPVAAKPPAVARRPLRRAAPKVVPTTGVDTREPESQNQHTLAMINSHQLGSTPMLIAMVASVEIAISAKKTGRPFGQAERELAHAYIASKTGLSEETVRVNAAKAVKLGFLERTDNAQGGKRDANGVGRNRSTYRARIPAYMTLDEPTP